jgi:GDP-L-fucose synthase
MKTTIFGAKGLLGSALVRTAPTNVGLACPSSSELDLRDEETDLWKKHTKDHCDLWINCAAKVGGVKANADFIADFFIENLKIGKNVIKNAKTLEVKKLVSVLSTCIYPDADYVEYPLTEDQLHNGPPHVSNYGYAYAKRMLEVGSRAYRQQWNCNFITVVPNNLYGLHDNYDESNGHVIPALIKKFYEAKINNTEVVIWGSGKQLREFTFSDDAAKIIWWCAKNYNEAGPINIGNTEEISIRDVAYEIARVIGYKNKIKFDTSKPEGQYRKPSSNKKLKSLGCDVQYTPFLQGIEIAVEFFIKNYPNIKGVNKNSE